MGPGDVSLHGAGGHRRGAFGAAIGALPAFRFTGTIVIAGEAIFQL